jgi:putative toxin-antitoxin system antitoxin component (TIGR02293 family)
MSAASVAKALGGAKVLKTAITSELDLATAAVNGLSAEAAAKVVAGGLLTADELYELVIPRRTFDRRREEKQPLTVVEADRLLRVVRVAVRAAEALGDPEKAGTWLRSPNTALRGETPMALLGTDIGARTVERILGRIEHGVYS